MPDSAPLPNAALTAKSAEPQVTTGPFPSSRKIHVPGRRHADIRVALREIDLEPSANEKPVRVYDTSGAYSDPARTTDRAARSNPRITASGAAKTATCPYSTAAGARSCAPSRANR